MNISLHHLLLISQGLMNKQLVSRISASEELDLSPGQPKILDFLSYSDGCDQKTIKEGCHLEAATVTNLLARMEASGLIERTRLNGNRRSLYVFLTDKGKENIRALNKIFAEQEAVATRGISEEDLDCFMRVLEKIHDNMLEEGGKINDQ